MRGRPTGQTLVMFALLLPLILLPIAGYAAEAALLATRAANLQAATARATEEGAQAIDVAAFRYTFTGFENNGTAYREIDAFGTPVPVPEPACVLLVCAAGGGLVWRTRRRTKCCTDPAGM